MSPLQVTPKFKHGAKRLAGTSVDLVGTALLADTLLRTASPIFGKLGDTT